MKPDDIDTDVERRDWQSWWSEKLEKNEKIAVDLALSGVKQSMLAHAAVAVIVLNALLGSPQRNELSLIFTLYAALIGLVLSGSGQALLFELITNFGSEVKSHLIRKRYSFRSMAAVAAFGDRYFARPYKLAVFLIYGSIIWLIIYLFVGVTFLAHGI